MSTLQVMKSLYDYHRWANERLLDAAAKLDESELSRDADIPFGNIQANLVHVLGSQVSWLMRLRGETPQLATVEPGRVIPALRESFRWAHDTFSRYIASLSDEEIERPTPFIEFEGENPHSLQRPLWEVLLSVGSHGIAHRGEVAIVLARLGANPEQMDYSEYAWRHNLRDSGSGRGVGQG